MFLAVLTIGVQFGDVKWPRAVIHAYTATHIISIILQIGWYVMLGRIPERAISRRHRTYLSIAAGIFAVLTFGTIALSLLGDLPDIWLLWLRTALLGALAYEVCRKHGIPLSVPSTETDHITRWRTAYKQTDTVVVYVICGTFSTMCAVMLLRWLDMPWLPVMRMSQEEALGANGPLDLLAGLPWVIVVEGVIIGVVSMLLHRAGRPTWQIYTSITVPEIFGHVYFGLPAVMMTLYVVLCARWYIRHHHIGPLLMGHLVVDVIGIAFLQLPWPGRIAGGIVFAAALTLLERWLDRKAASPGGAPDPTAHRGVDTTKSTPVAENQAAPPAREDRRTT